MKIRTFVIPALIAAATGLAAGLAYQPAKEHAKQPAKEHATQPAKEHVKQPDGAGMDPKLMEMMQKMMEAGTPGEAHAMMAKQVGEWEFVNTFRMDPSMPEMTSTGTASFKSLFDGRYVEADMMGQPFHGRATMGYNNMTKKFESTWIDSMSTQTMFGTGTYDAAKKQMTVVMEGTDCMTGKPCKMTEVTTHHDDNHFTSEFTMPDMNGKDFKGMTIKYTRKGASESHSPAKAPATKAPATKPAR